MAKGKQGDDSQKNQDQNQNKKEKGGKGDKQGWVGQVMSAANPLAGGMLAEISKLIRDSGPWKKFQDSNHPVALLFKGLARNRVSRVILNTGLEELKNAGVPPSLITEMQNLVEYASESPVETHGTKDEKSELTIAYEELNFKLDKLDQGLRQAMYVKINSVPKTIRGEAVKKLSAMTETQFKDLCAIEVLWNDMVQTAAKDSGHDKDGFIKTAETTVNKLLSELADEDRRSMTSRLNKLSKHTREKVVAKLATMTQGQILDFCIAEGEFGDLADKFWNELVTTQRDYLDVIKEKALAAGKSLLEFLFPPKDDDAKTERMQRVREASAAAKKKRAKSKKSLLAAWTKLKKAAGGKPVEGE